MSPKQIALASGVDHEVTKKLVVKMADAGQLETFGSGIYDIPLPSVPPVPSNTYDGERGEQGEYLA